LNFSGIAQICSSRLGNPQVHHVDATSAIIILESWFENNESV